MDPQQIISYSTNIVSLLTAIGALLLSYRVYLSQKSIENENQLFNHKMSSYQVIIQHATGLHEIYYEALLELRDFPEEILLDQNEAEELADEIDSETARFRLILHQHGSFLPKNITRKLDDYFNHLYDQSEIIIDEKQSIKNVESMLDQLDKYEDDLEEIINLMRNDLGIEVIDRKLKSRTHR